MSDDQVPAQIPAPTGEDVLPATTAYRHKIACGIASGGLLPKVASVVFGRGTTPYSPNDTALEDEVYRAPILSAVADGPDLLVTAVLDGAMTGDATITEYGYIDSDGTLMGRKTWKPKTLEPNTQIELRSFFYF